tara:strand:+ start:690 stop:836 length:147 start_codon:yes stop_codon:yes gene_type:complete
VKNVKVKGILFKTQILNIGDCKIHLEDGDKYWDEFLEIFMVYNKRREV